MYILLFKNSLFNFQKIVDETPESKFIILDSDDTLPQTIKHDAIFMILAHVEDRGLETALKRSKIPLHTPCLLLISGKTPPNLTQKNSQRFLDHLFLPVDNILLKNKIQFLKKVYQQGQKLVTITEELNSTKERLTDYLQTVEEHSNYLDLLSNRDGLTGLYNRHHFAKTLQHEYLRTMEEREDLSLLLLNIDYFNETNKKHGIGFGDFVLNELGARLTQNNRPSDTCFRYGGEEFIVLMPGTNLETATSIAKNLLSACKGKAFNNGVVSKTITCSIGVASRNAHSPEDHEELIVMADQALYFAKSEGRDRVSAFRSLSDSPFNTSDKNFINLKKTLARILNKTRSSTINSLQLLAKDVAPKENLKHIEATKQYIQLLCEHLRLPTTIIDTFKNAITLHTSIHHLLHSEIINKRDSLSKDDKNIIQDFPYKLMEVTQLFDYFSNERTILLHHGEHYDGSGYPEGLHGDAIPLGARIFNLIDALVAMESNRPYRPKLQPKEILNELVKFSGSQFDPFLVLKLIDVIEEHALLVLEESDFSQARNLLLKR